MTLSDSVAVTMYEQRIDTLQGEAYSLQRDNELLTAQRDAALDHAQNQSTEAQRFKLMYQETSKKYIDICKEISQIRNELVSLQVEYDEINEERQRLQNIVYRLKGAS